MSENQGFRRTDDAPNAKACPRCGKVTNLHASVCENCGRQFKTQFENKTQVFNAPPAPAKTTAIGGGVLFVLAVLALLFFSAKANVGPNNTSACVAAKQFVKDSLTAPSSADFPPCYDVQTTELGDGRYFCKGYVEADNAFGAHLRQNWSCTVRHIDGINYSCESVGFGDSAEDQPQSQTPTQGVPPVQ